MGLRLKSLSYRDSHTKQGYGEFYNRTYKSGYYAAQWRSIEEPLLAKLLFKYGGNSISALDFACGTGRITSVACKFFGHVTAVDISQEMLAENPCSEAATLHCIDLTSDDLNETFDVALAFRFFLNAENELRMSALNAISRHLKSNGIFICNIHMRRQSPMGIFYNFLSKILKISSHMTLSEIYFETLLHQSGFKVISIEYYGYMPRIGPFFPRISSFFVPWIEKLGVMINAPKFLAQSCIIVCQKH
jgi:SAM-dependent methyltransferase